MNLKFKQSCNGRRCSNCYYYSVIADEKWCCHPIKRKKIINRRNFGRHIYYDEVPTMILDKKTTVWDVRIWSDIKADALENIVNHTESIPITLSIEPNNQHDKHAIVILSDLPQWLIGGQGMTCAGKEWRRMGYISREAAFHAELHKYIDETEHGYISAELYLNRDLNLRYWTVLSDALTKYDDDEMPF